MRLILSYITVKSSHNIHTSRTSHLPSLCSPHHILLAENFVRFSYLKFSSSHIQNGMSDPWIYAYEPRCDSTVLNFQLSNFPCQFSSIIAINQSSFVIHPTSYFIWSISNIEHVRRIWYCLSNIKYSSIFNPSTSPHPSLASPTALY